MTSFLDKIGLQRLWDAIVALFAKKEDVVVINATAGTSGTAAATSKPYYATRWRVDLSDQVTELYTGLTILFKIPVAGNGTYGTLLRIDGTVTADDSSSNLYPVCANVSTMIGTRYAVGCVVALTFDATQAGQTLYYNSNSAYTTAANGSGWTKPGCWKIADYDSNTTITYGTLDYYFRPYTAVRLTPYKIVALDKDNRVIPITTEQYCGAYSTSTSYVVNDIVSYSDAYWICTTAGKNKTPSASSSYWQAYTMPTQFTPTTTPFRPEKLRFYGTTTLLAAGAATGGQTLTEIGYNTSVCTYTFWATIATYKVIYLQGTYDKTTGLFTLDSGANYYKTVPCNTANITLSDYFTSGKYYILLGATYSSNNYFQLFMVNTMYYFDGTNLVPYENKLASDVAASIPTVPTNVSSFTNDAGYLTSYTETDPTVPSWAKASSKPSYTASEVGAVPTTRKVNGKALSADITLSASDVSALPSSTTIPTKVSDLTNDSGFTTNTGTITGITMNGASKGTSGVVDLGTVITSETALSKGTTSGSGNAVTDLSVSGHQITLTKGTTFLTSETSLSKGTTSGSGNAVTDISVSGHQITLTKGSTFLTSHQDISGKADKSEMSVVAGTGANADKTTITLKSGTSATVLTSHQDISGKQNTLTFDTAPTSSSSNPVTSGGVYTALSTKANSTDLTAEASTRSTADSTLSTQISAKADKTAEVDHGTSDTTFTLTPNVFHKWGTVSSLTLTLGTGTSGEYNEYMFQFTSGSTPTTLSLPNSVIWVQPLTVQASKTYQVSIVNNLAAYITDGMAAAESSGGTPTYATESWVTSLIDNAPTANSSNVPSSGGTYSMIEGGFYYS